MPLSRDDIIARLVRAGELEVLGGDAAETASYFAVKVFRFHGPDGLETDYAGLGGYFNSVRAAFDELSIRRGVMLVDGDHVACRTWIEGRFVRPFTQSPVGALPPNGRRIVFDLANIFRLDGEGRLEEEWVWTDNRSLLRQLQA